MGGGGVRPGPAGHRGRRRTGTGEPCWACRATQNLQETLEIINIYSLNFQKIKQNDQNKQNIKYKRWNLNKI